MAGESRESTFVFHAQADELKEVAALLDSIGARMSGLQTGAPGGGGVTQTGPATFSAMGSNIFGSGGVRDNPRAVGGGGTSIAPINAAGSAPIGMGMAGGMSVGVVNISAQYVTITAQTVTLSSGGVAAGGGGGTAPGGGGGMAFPGGGLPSYTPQGIIQGVLGSLPSPMLAPVGLAYELASQATRGFIAGTRPTFQTELSLERARMSGQYIAPAQQEMMRIEARQQGALAISRNYDWLFSHIPGLDIWSENRNRDIEASINTTQGMNARIGLYRRARTMALPVIDELDGDDPSKWRIDRFLGTRLGIGGAMRGLGTRAAAGGAYPGRGGPDFASLQDEGGYSPEDIATAYGGIAAATRAPGRYGMRNAIIGGADPSRFAREAAQEMILRGDTTGLANLAPILGIDAANAYISEESGFRTSQGGMSARAAQLRGQTAIAQTRAEFFGTPGDIFRAQRAGTEPLQIERERLAGQLQYQDPYQRAETGGRMAELLAQILSINVSSERHLASMNTSIVSSAASVGQTVSDRTFMLGGGGMGAFGIARTSAGLTGARVGQLEAELRLLTPGSESYAAKLAQVETARTAAVSAQHAVPLGVLPAGQRIEQMTEEFRLQRQTRSYTESGSVLDTQQKLNTFTQRKLNLLDQEEAAESAAGPLDPGRREQYAIERQQLQMEMWTRNLSLSEGFLERLPMRSSSPPSFAGRLKPSYAEAAAALNRRGIHPRSVGFATGGAIQAEMERGATTAGRSMSDIFPGEGGWAGMERFGKRGGVTRTRGGADPTAVMGGEGGDSATLKDIAESLKLMVQMMMSGQLMRPGGGPTPTGGFTSGANTVTETMGQQRNDVGNR